MLLEEIVRLGMQPLESSGRAALTCFRARASPRLEPSLDQLTSALLAALVAGVPTASDAIRTCVGWGHAPMLTHQLWQGTMADDAHGLAGALEGAMLLRKPLSSVTALR